MDLITTSFEFENLTTCSSVSIRQCVEESIENTPTSDRLSRVLTFFDKAAALDDHVLEITWEVWQVLLDQELWRKGFKSVEECKDAANYNYTFRRMLGKNGVERPKQVGTFGRIPAQNSND